MVQADFKNQKERFFEQEVYPLYLSHSTFFKQEIFKNKEVYAKLIIEATDQFFRVLVLKQQKGYPKIKSINLEALYSAVELEHGKFIIRETDEEMAYDMSSYLKSLLVFKQELMSCSKKYIDKALKDEISKFIISYFVQYISGFMKLAQYALNQILKLDSFKTLQKEEDFYIAVGEYYDAKEIIFNIKNTYPTNLKALQHIREADENRAYGIFQEKIVIQDEAYLYYDFRNTYFNKGQFSKVKFEKSILSPIFLEQALLDEVSFNGSVLHDAFFNESSWHEVSMQNVYADIRNVQGLKIDTGYLGIQCKKSHWSNVTCKRSTLCGVDFTGTTFKNCHFIESDLSYCHFIGCTFENVSFSQTLLYGCLFDEQALQALSLTSTQKEQIGEKL